MNHRQDQAETLRAWAQHRAATMGPDAADSLVQSKKEPTRVVAIGGGKGGIGKTVIAANLACMLGQLGCKTLAVDADLGLSNLDLALGAAPVHTVLDVIEGMVGIGEAVVPVAPNVALLGGTLGRMELVGLPPHARLSLTDAIGTLHPAYDVVVLDLPSGVGEHVMHFAKAAAHVVVVATPEPTALADAYAFVKVVRSHCGIKEALFVANMVRSQAEGERLYGRLAQLCDRFLGVDLGFLGALCLDQGVSNSVRSGRPFVTHAPESLGKTQVEAMAARLLRRVQPDDMAAPTEAPMRLGYNFRRLMEERA